MSTTDNFSLLHFPVWHFATGPALAVNQLAAPMSPHTCPESALTLFFDLAPAMIFHGISPDSPEPYYYLVEYYSERCSPGKKFVCVACIS